MDKKPKRDWTFAFCSIGGLVGFVLLYLVFVFEPTSGKETFWLGQGGVAGLLLSTGTLTAAVAAGWQAIRAYNLSRATEVGARFQKGAEMLASPEITSRIGGLYLLRDVAREAPAQYYTPVADLLSSFATLRCAEAWSAERVLELHHRNPTEITFQELESANAARNAFKETPADVIKAVEMIGDLRKTPAIVEIETETGRRPSLSRIVLRWKGPMDGNFDGLGWMSCIFENAHFAEATFRNGTFFGTELKGINSFDGCVLDDAWVGSIRPRNPAQTSLRLTRVSLRGASVLTDDNLAALIGCDITKMELQVRAAHITDCWIDSPTATPRLRIRDATSDLKFKVATGHRPGARQYSSSSGAKFYRSEDAAGFVEVAPESD